ncbi:MAG: metallophosphoesterase [Bacteroidota bacterium]
MKKSIAFITDLHIDEAFPIEHGVDARANFERILADLRSRDIEQVFIGGDIGENAALEWFFDTLNDFKLDLVLGNHDEFKAVRKHHSSKLSNDSSEWFYTFDDPFFTYIFMDSSSATISDTQFNWLQAAVQTTKDILLFIHHPILPVQTIVDQKYPLYDRDMVQNLLSSLPNKVTVFCGHYHTNDEQKVGNITQYVTAACSFQALKNTEETVVDTSNFGYRLIHLDGIKIKTQPILFDS